MLVAVVVVVVVLSENREQLVRVSVFQYLLVLY